MCQQGTTVARPCLQDCTCVGCDGSMLSWPLNELAGRDGRACTGACTVGCSGTHQYEPAGHGTAWIVATFEQEKPAGQGPPHRMLLWFIVELA